jgi:hypothetical protein
MTTPIPVPDSGAEDEVITFPLATLAIIEGPGAEEEIRGG